MSKIRVLRLLEYTYDSVEEYEKDRERWTLKSPPMNRNKMKSVELPLEVLDD